MCALCVLCGPYRCVSSVYLYSYSMVRTICLYVGGGISNLELT